MAGTRVPSYRLHRPSGRAVVTIDGRDVYLGEYGTAASRRAYDRAIGAWLAAGRDRPAAGTAGRGITCARVAQLYRAHAARYYVKRGRETTHAAVVRRVMARWEECCGQEPLAAFGPRAFRAVRETWVRDGCCRRTANDYAKTLRAAVKWAVGQELAPGSVLEALRAVEGLAPGRTEAPERPPVGPVPAEAVAAVLGLLAPHWRACVLLQAATGMRPGEAVALRPCDLDRSAEPWAYVPPGHKTEHLGRAKLVPLGPRAREVLAPWLLRAGSDALPVFRAPGRNVAYSVRGYRRAIERACRTAGIPAWAPHRLRHSAATAISAAYGLDGARAALGHADPQVTLRYADRDYRAAAAIAEAMG